MLEGSKPEKKPLIKGIIEDKALESTGDDNKSLTPEEDVRQTPK